MFVESHQFVSEVLEIQDKFQHVCRIVSIRIRQTCLDMFDESLNLNKFRHVSTCTDMFENCMNCNNSYHIESEQV